MILKPGIFLQGRYEILEKIGSGGMSDVYKAKDHKLNRLVAIKVLKEEFGTDETFVSKFKMEAQAAAGLSHPNIVNVYDVMDEENIHYIVMELVEGITLKSYIATKKKLNVKETLGISIQVAQGIAAAHKRGIIHRDIKPQNMIISKDGKVKVTDFGIARAVSAQTIGGAAVGSVHYICPEQAKGALSDQRSDIYSLGITIYEMITGKVPFDGDTTVAIALSHLEDPLPLPSLSSPDIPAGLESIILKCTQKKPERRYQTMEDLLVDLRKALIDPNDPSLLGNTTTINGDTRRMSEEEMGEINARHAQNQHTLENVMDGDVDEARDAFEVPDFPEETSQDESKDSFFVPELFESSSSDASDFGKKEEKNEDEEREERRGIRSEQLMAALGVGGAVVAIVLLLILGRNIGKAKTVVSPTGANGETTLASNQTKVPDLDGKTQDEAEKILQEATLSMKVTGNAYSDSVPKGQVISQDPKSDEVVSKHSSVGVVISNGSQKVDLASLGITSMNAKDAKTALKSEGFSVNTEEEYSDSVEEGGIIRFVPEQPEKGSEVTIVISKGKKNTMTVVPNIVNQPEAAGTNLLISSNLKPGNRAVQYSDTVKAGDIISQSPEPGAQATLGSKVDYVISQGPAPTESSTESATKATKATKAEDKKDVNATASAELSPESNYQYVGSIDTTFELKDLIGPGGSSSKVKVMIRLRQDVNGQTVYRTLMEPRNITGDTILPVRFKSIVGADGVEDGNVEVVDADTQNVLKSYDVQFFKVQ